MNRIIRFNDNDIKKIILRDYLRGVIIDYYYKDDNLNNIINLNDIEMIINNVVEDIEKNNKNFFEINSILEIYNFDIFEIVENYIY
jgi:hypothetical protein